MSMSRALSAIVRVSLCVLAGAELADDEPQCTIERPAAHAVYVPTSDIVVAGTSEHCAVGVAKLIDVNNVIQQSGSFRFGTDETNGAWFCVLPVPRAAIFRAGNYGLGVHAVARPASLESTLVPIRIVADPDGPKAPQPLPTTKPGTAAYDDLSKLQLAEITLSNSDHAEPELSDRGKKAEDAIEVKAGAEFAVEGWFRVAEVHEFLPCDVVLRLRGKIRRLEKDAVADSRPGGEANTFITATVAETIAKVEPRDAANEFDYIGVMRAPNRTGNLTLEAVYRRVVIASASVEIKPQKE